MLKIEVMVSYSIIIPHKNTPELLQFCLNSIPVRDDIQVIVIDDNSDPREVDFNHFPRWEGEHFELFLTKEGKGAGYARNIGLNHAKGKWILFVDADDYLLPSFSEILDKEIESIADIIFFRPKAVMLKDRVSGSRRADQYNNYIDLYVQTQDEMPLRCRWLSACSKFYRSELIQNNGICFDEIRYSNDNVFSVKAGVCARSISVSGMSFYCITESSSSLTSDFMNKPGELQLRADAFFRAQEIVSKNGYPVDEGVALFLLRKLFSENRKAFRLNYRRMREIGYNNKWLLHELFRMNSKLSSVKRIAYTYISTLFS